MNVSHRSTFLVYGAVVFAFVQFYLSMNAILQEIQEPNTEAHTIRKRDTETPSVFEPHELCSFFPSEQFTATRLWQQMLPRIANASKNPLIPELLTDEEDAKMQQLLQQTLSPSRFRRAVRHIPTASHHIVKHVVEILQKRIRDPDNHPPLRVAVFGGSVTIGRGCFHKGMGDMPCAWPQRLELLINQFAQKDIVKVYNLGVGGTASGTGTKMVKYWMYQDELSKVGPDVIINSYSTNDSLPPWNLKPEEDAIVAVMDQAREGSEQFVREALQSKHPCKVPPLVVHVDDYLGPQQSQLLGELSYITAVTQIAKWYDTMAVSYGEVVRDLFYMDSADPTFGNSKDVHYGRWAHLAIAWSVGFASMDLVSSYCDDEHNARVMTADKAGLLSNSTLQNDEEHTNAKEGLLETKMFLPPPLTRDLQLKDATAEFTNALQTTRQSLANIDCTTYATTSQNNEDDENPCIISFIAAPGGFNANALNNFMNQNTRSNNGWSVENSMKDGWANKIGWIAEKENASFSLKFDNISKDVKTVTIHFIRSYGEKWKDSRAKVSVLHLGGGGKDDDDDDETKDKALSEVEIDGVFKDESYTYSLTLSETMSLSETIKKGESMAIDVELVSGSHFKVMGLMICNK